MDLTLVLVTLLSLALAAVMTVLAWRLAREERRRSEGRVAMLATEIHGATDESRAPSAAATGRLASVGRLERVFASDRGPVRVASPTGSPRGTPSATGAPRGIPSGAGAPRVASGVGAPRVLDDDLPLRQANPVVTSTDLFASAAEPPRSRAAGVTAVVAAVVVVAAFAWYVTAHSSILAGAVRARPAAASPARVDSTAGTAALELTALTHDRDADRLTVRGIVRNPRNGATVRGLSAVVYLFNRAGAFATSGRATIDVLASGSESPFAVTIPNVGDVGRYRVTFKADDRIVPHVDRRDRTAAEAKQP